MDEQQTNEQNACEEPAAAQTEDRGSEPSSDGGAAASADTGTPAVDSAKSEADKDQSVRDTTVKGLDVVEKGMEKLGGKAGKYIGKAMTFAGNRVNEGIAQQDKEMGSYGNKTTTDADGNESAQARTTASVAADAGVQANLNARNAAGKVWNNETFKSVAGTTAGAATTIGHSAVDAGVGLYRGTKSWLSDKYNRLKSAVGVNP